MCGWLSSEFICFRVCFPFHPNLLRLVSAPAAQPFWETRDRRLDKETSTIHDLNHTGKKTNRGSSGLDSEYLVFVPHVKEVGLGHSSQIQFRWISHLPTLDKRIHTHSTFDPVCFKNEGD